MSHNNSLPTLKSCSCGSSNINSENWKDRRRIITCLICDRKVWADTNRQAINAWNKGRTGDCDDEPGPITMDSLQFEIARLRAENEAMREGVNKAIKELEIEINQCERCGKTTPMTDYNIYSTLEALRAKGGES